MSNEAYKFWMVWRENSPTTRFQHMTKQDAEREAERLAKSHPGETFFVLKSVSGIVADAPKVTRLKLIQDEIPF